MSTPTTAAPRASAPIDGFLKFLVILAVAGWMVVGMATVGVLLLTYYQSELHSPATIKP